MEYEERLVRVVIARYDDYSTIYPEGYIYVSLDEEDTSNKRLQAAKRLSTYTVISTITAVRNGYQEPNAVSQGTRWRHR